MNCCILLYSGRKSQVEQISKVEFLTCGMMCHPSHDAKICVDDVM